MGIVETCVWFCIFVATILVTGLFSLFSSWVSDDVDFTPYMAWIIVSIGFSICLTYIVSIKGII